MLKRNNSKRPDDDRKRPITLGVINEKSHESSSIASESSGPDDPQIRDLSEQTRRNDRNEITARKNSRQIA